MTQILFIVQKVLILNTNKQNEFVSEHQNEEIVEKFTIWMSGRDQLYGLTLQSEESAIRFFYVRLEFL